MPGPLVDFLIRRQFRKQARAEGKSFFQITRALSKWDRYTVEDAALQVAGGFAALQEIEDLIPDDADSEEGLSAIGDGEILKKILAFIEGPIGQMILQILKSLLFV